MDRVRTVAAQNFTVDRLSLQLPPGFEHRADSIARRLGDELSRLTWPGDCEREHLPLAPQSVRPEQSDLQIAAQIARAIHRQITRGRG
jgi:hypothetical protein